MLRDSECPLIQESTATYREILWVWQVFIGFMRNGPLVVEGSLT